MTPRALAIDLDGTLLSPGDDVSPGNAAAVRAALDAGLEVIIATARWYQMALKVAAPFGIDGPVIACSGAQVRRISDEVDLMDVRLPPEFAAQLYEVCDANRCIAFVALDEEVLVKAEGIFGTAAAWDLRFVDGLAAATAEGGGVPPRIALVQGTEVNDLIETTMAPDWMDRVRFVESLSGGGRRILTLTATGADKGAALAVACADLGLVPADVVAIGDAHNDIEMFRVAGASFAMGQAADEVKAAATAVTADNASDGVALAIERVLAGALP